MKWSKTILLVIFSSILISLGYTLFSLSFPENIYNPLNSNQNDYLKKLEFALDSNQIKPVSNLKYQPYAQLITFNYQNSQVILSATKDPYLQSASLQKIFQVSTIKGKIVRLVNLSLNHPYVSLQDN